jgi:hypothetical protein
LIYNRLKATGRLGSIEEIHPAKDFSVSTNPARYVHEAYKDQGEEKEASDGK